MELADFQTVLQHCNNVTALHFTRTTIYSVPESWMESFFKLPRLAHLTFTTKETLQYRNIRHLKSLSVGLMPREYYKELVQLTNLTHLELLSSIGETSALTIEQLTNLLSLSIEDVLDSGSSIFETVTNLTKLRIRSNLPRKSTSVITNLHNLKCMVVNNTIQDLNIDSFIQLTSLESISIKISDNTAALTKLLQMTNLTKLSLKGARIHTKSWSLLTDMTKLKCLDVKGSYVSVSANSCGSLGSLRQLQKFKISFNQNMNILLETIINAGIVLKSLWIQSCQQMTTSTIKLIVQLTSLQKLEILNTTLDTDIYHVTVLSDLRSLLLINYKLMSVRPFMALTKLRNITLDCHVIQEEIDLIQPSTMICLEKFHCPMMNKLKRF